MKKHEMKAKLRQLDTLPLPDRETLLTACGVSAASQKQSTRSRHLRPMIAAIAAAVLLISGGTMYTVAAEARAYQSAVQFFDDYNLSTDGLSRTEIKQVWRDITTGSFSSPATAALLEQSAQRGEVSGYTIPLATPTPEVLEALWNQRNAVHSKAGVSYKTREEYREDAQHGATFERALLEQHQNETLTWTAEFHTFAVADYLEYQDYVLVWGNTLRNSNTERQFACLALLDAASGQTKWCIRPDNGYHTESIAAVIPEGDELVVFSRGNLTDVVFSRYAIDGNRLAYHATEVGNYGLWNAAKLGDGYLLQLGSYVEGEYARLVRVSADGTLGEVLTYSSEDTDYYIVDMCEFGGKIYLSTYAVPHLAEGESTAGGRNEIAAILNQFDGRLSISSAELTPMLQQHYSAVLLVCNPTDGTPDKFYAVDGARGDDLTINEDGTLVWEVGQIAQAHYSPMTSAYTIAAETILYRYVFDESGALRTQEQTGELGGFCK